VTIIFFSDPLVVRRCYRMDPDARMRLALLVGVITPRQPTF
jgi:hypothetical protein